MVSCFLQMRIACMAGYANWLRPSVLHCVRSSSISKPVQRSMSLVLKCLTGSEPNFVNRGFISASRGSRIRFATSSREAVSWTKRRDFCYSAESTLRSLRISIRSPQRRCRPTYGLLWNMNNRICLLSGRIVEQVVAMVKGPCRKNPETDCDLHQAAGTRHTQITIAVRLVRTLVSVCFLFAPCAIAQEEWQRQDRAGSHDFGVNSQRADS